MIIFITSNKNLAGAANAALVNECTAHNCGRLSLWSSWLEIVEVVS
jgi:hypothetical protein